MILGAGYGGDLKHKIYDSNGGNVDILTLQIRRACAMHDVRLGAWPDIAAFISDPESKLSADMRKGFMSQKFATYLMLDAVVAVGADELSAQASRKFSTILTPD